MKQETNRSISNPRAAGEFIEAILGVALTFAATLIMALIMITIEGLCRCGERLRCNSPSGASGTDDAQAGQRKLPQRSFPISPPKASPKASRLAKEPLARSWTPLGLNRKRDHIRGCPLPTIKD